MTTFRKPPRAKRTRFSIASAIVLVSAATTPVVVRAQTSTPTALIVSAHHDDHTMFAAAVYRITRGLGGAVDHALITDGAGGYRYSGLSEPIYGIDLTDERVAREHLSAVRRRELLAGDTILGIRNHFFLDEPDQGYTEDIDSVLTHVWRTDRVRNRLQELMIAGVYDYVFVHLPPPAWHGHHKAAAVLALQAATSLPVQQQPVVLGSFLGANDDTTLTGYVEHPGYPITRVRSGGPHFLFDRTQPADETDRLNYHIVVNWVIAEHKSQGMMQNYMNWRDVERFWYFSANGPARFEETAAFFSLLNRRR